jgi:ribosomal protein S18 acetylase RimI-like enzyme
MKAMNSFVYRAMKPDDHNVVRNMVKALYASLQAPDGYMTDEKIDATFARLSVPSGHLELDVFECDGFVVGYALMFKFWYNEFGGMILNIDELFVLPDFRSRGIASHYLSTLGERKDDYVALALEVLPENERAHALYKRMGFTEKETRTLYKFLE